MLRGTRPCTCSRSVRYGKGLHRQKHVANVFEKMIQTCASLIREDQQTRPLLKARYSLVCQALTHDSELEMMVEGESRESENLRVGEEGD